MAWKRFGKAQWLSFPRHLRRGLLRLYAAVTVPWVLYFAYHIFDAINRRPYGPVWRYISSDVWWLLIVPLGGPVLFFVIVWVIAGFRQPGSRAAQPAPKFSEAAPQSDPTAQRLMADYYRVLARAVSQLANDTPEARQTLYDRARTALAVELRGHEPPLTESRIQIERLALEAAISQIEGGVSPDDSRPGTSSQQPKEQPTAYELETRKNPSTGFLIATILFFRVGWALDFTSMSLFWVARLPKPPKPYPPNLRAPYFLPRSKRGN